MGEVLEVGDLTGAPQLCERRDVPVLQQIREVRGQDIVVDVVTKLVKKSQNNNDFQEKV